MATLTTEMISYLCTQAGLLASAGHTYSIRLGSATLTSASTFATRNELTTAGGYTAGGQTLTISSAGLDGSVYEMLTTTNPSWTGSGAGYTRASIMLVDDTASRLVSFINDAKTVAAGDVDAVNTTVAELFRLGAGTIA